MRDYSYRNSYHPSLPIRSLRRKAIREDIHEKIHDSAISFLKCYADNDIDGPANAFTQIGLAEELGSGTRNLFRYSRAFMGGDPSLVDGSTFLAMIPDVVGVLKGGDIPARKKLSIDDAILGLASAGDSFTLSEAAEVAGVSKRSASTHISSLIEAGMLIGEGSTRDRRYRRY